MKERTYDKEKKHALRSFKRGDIHSRGGTHIQEDGHSFKRRDTHSRGHTRVGTHIEEDGHTRGRTHIEEGIILLKGGNLVKLQDTLSREGIHYTSKTLYNQKYDIQSDIRRTIKKGTNFQEERYTSRGGTQATGGKQGRGGIYNREEKQTAMGSDT